MLRTYKFPLEIPHPMPYGSKLSPLSLRDWLLWHGDLENGVTVHQFHLFIHIHFHSRYVLGQRTYHECLKENSRQIFATTSYGTSRAYVPETKTTKSIVILHCNRFHSNWLDVFQLWFKWEISNKASKMYQVNKHCVWALFVSKHWHLRKYTKDRDRLDICRQIYTTGFLGQKFCTLKTHKSRLFSHTVKQPKCIKLSFW